MTKFTRILLFALCALMGGVNSVFAAKDVTEGDFVFNFYDNGKAYVKEYIGFAPEVNIPATINHDASGGTGSTEVIGIGEGAFEGNTTIQKVHLSRNNTYALGARAFKGCTALTTLNWKGSGATSYITDNRVYIPTTNAIPESAFEGCTSITTVVCRYTTKIAYGTNSFKGCTSLVRLSIYSRDIGESAFENCPLSTSVTFNSGSANVNIAIKAKAFKNSSLTSIILSATTNYTIAISSIGESAFEGCASLTSISCPEVTEIPVNAFKGCTALTTPSFEKATSIGESAFEGCTSLASVTFANVTTIGNSAFEGCTSLTSLAFEKVTSIGNRAFCNTGLEYVNVGLNQEGTEYTAFLWTSIPQVVSVGDYAFAYCNNLKRVYLRATSIGEYAFRQNFNADSFQQIRLSKVSSIGTGAFMNIKSTCKIFIDIASLSDDLLGNLSDKQKNKICPYVYFSEEEGEKGFVQLISCKLPLHLGTTTALKVSKVTGIADTGSGINITTATASSKIVPANTAVVISYTGSYPTSFMTSVSLADESDTPADHSDNLLIPADVEKNLVSANNVNYYKLNTASTKDNIQFEKIESATDIPAGSGYLAIMTLDGNENTNYADAIAAHNGERVTMNFTRDITAKKWSTICLPFELNSSQQTSVFGAGVEVAKLTESTESTLKFATLSDETMAANTPYAIKVASDFSTATIPNVTLSYATPTPSVTAGKWTFTGVYTHGNIPAGSYFFSNNKLWRAADDTDTNTIKAFRGYFTNNSGAGAREVDFSVDDELTGIKTVGSGVQDVENEYFDLQGRKVAQPTKGLYIVNGKKIIVK